jgi:ascorbate-specific PTS system EIIC-type component UlaA
MRDIEKVIVSMSIKALFSNPEISLENIELPELFKFFEHKNFKTFIILHVTLYGIYMFCPVLLGRIWS